MARLLRPHIPISVRVKVAERQVRDHHLLSAAILDGYDPVISKGKWLKILLWHLFGDEPFHLDHDPALVNRQFNERTQTYTPDANDPKYLIYRTKTDHDIKTRIRGDGALRSDLSQARYNKQVAKNRDPGKPKRKWNSRPLRSASRWPKKEMRQSR